uniref:Uncharacterized protein n=1 Tax=Poecilia formosa TaxID=48698 RepID=A0A096LRH5_POEFO
ICKLVASPLFKAIKSYDPEMGGGGNISNVKIFHHIATNAKLIYDIITYLQELFMKKA